MLLLSSFDVIGISFICILVVFMWRRISIRSSVERCPSALGRNTRRRSVHFIAVKELPSDDMSKRTLDASRGSDIHKHSAFIAKSALWRTTTEGRKSSLLSSPLAAVGQDASRHNIKKQSAGLATVLASQDSFEDCDVFGDAGQENRIGLKFTPHTPSATTNHGVYIDENDFSSDIDLDVEDPALKSTITYPKLPLTHEDAKVTFTKSVATKSVAAKAFAAKSLRQIPTSSNPLPWSSSPVFDQSPNIDAHVAKLLRDSEVQSVAVAEEAEEEERPAKRRSLPWPKSEVDRSQLSKTPHRKASNGELYALDTTASAIKTRQKDLRLKNKGHATAARPTGVDVKDDAVKKPKKLGISKLHLSDEQKHILDLVLNRGKSVFYTGSAGM